MSKEYVALSNCAEKLESAIRLDINEIIHYLYREGFISKTVYEEVLELKSPYSDADKATKLVLQIRGSVELDSSKYFKLVNHFRQNSKRFSGIVATLDSEYFGIPFSQHGPQGKKFYSGVVL